MARSAVAREVSATLVASYLGSNGDGTIQILTKAGKRCRTLTVKLTEVKWVSD